MEEPAPAPTPISTHVVKQDMKTHYPQNTVCLTSKTEHNYSLVDVVVWDMCYVA